MAIVQRELKEIRWTHSVTTRQYTARFSVREGRVAAADPQLHSLLGKRYDAVRELCSRYSWELEALHPRKSA